jgi:hypothetical protein
VVLNGFYKQYKKAIACEPNIGMLSCRCNNIDENNELLFVSDLIQKRSGLLYDSTNIFVTNNIYCPSVVVRRQVYEQIGGFSHKCGAAADWDMWKRILAYHIVWYDTDVLLSYRWHENRSSSNLITSGLIFKSIRESIKLSRACIGLVFNKKLELASHRHAYFEALRHAEAFIDKKDITSAKNIFYEAMKFNVPLITKAKNALSFIRMILR